MKRITSWSRRNSNTWKTKKMALFTNNNSVQNPSVHVGVLIGANFYRDWNPWNLLGVKLIFIKQNLIGVLWGALVEEIVGKKRWHATGLQDRCPKTTFKQPRFCEDKLVTRDQSIKQNCDNSWEYKKFPNLMNKTKRMVSVHYELPSPFKSDETTLPKNNIDIKCYKD